MIETDILPRPQLGRVKDNRTVTGLYVIRLDDKPVYCGQSIDVNHRVSNHRAKIVKGEWYGMPTDLTRYSLTILPMDRSELLLAEFKYHLMNPSLLSKSYSGHNQIYGVFANDQYVPFINEFCRENNLTVSLVHKVLSGQRKTHKGYTFRYATREEAIYNLFKEV